MDSSGGMIKPDEKLDIAAASHTSESIFPCFDAAPAPVAFDTAVVPATKPHDQPTPNKNSGIVVAAPSGMKPARTIKLVSGGTNSEK